MKKILSFNLVLALAMMGAISPPPAWSAPGVGVYLPITAPSALLIDAETHKVIYAKSPHSRRTPASTTKLLTALVILKNVPLDATVRIPSWVDGIEPSKAHLRPGEHYRVRDLLHATLISSANDAAEVLAVSTAGSRAQFASWMNAKARALGCRNTHFTNASGLPLGRQYSTAYDLALIMNQAEENAFIVDSLSRRHHTISSLEGRPILLRNHNRLLWKTHNAVIGKTGWTRKGRHCFVGRINWRGRDVLVSLMGSHRLWQDLNILVNYQFGLSIFKIRKNKKIWSSSQIKEIQKALARAGYSAGDRDGVFGPQTVRAVEGFQKSHGLRSDGVVGPQTCRKLKRYGLPQSYCR